MTNYANILTRHFQDLKKNKNQCKISASSIYALPTILGDQKKGNCNALKTYMNQSNRTILSNNETMEVELASNYPSLLSTSSKSTSTESSSDFDSFLEKIYGFLLTFLKIQYDEPSQKESKGHRYDEKKVSSNADRDDRNAKSSLENSTILESWNVSLRQWINFERKENTDSNLLRRLPALIFAIERYDDAIQRFSSALENYLSIVEDENKKRGPRKQKMKRGKDNVDNNEFISQVYENLLPIQNLSTRHLLIQNKEKEKSTYTMSKKRSRATMEQSEKKVKQMNTEHSLGHEIGNHEDYHDDDDEEGYGENNQTKAYLCKRINIFGHDRGGIKRGRSKANRSRLRSRNKVIDAWLDGEDGRDAYVDLEDFIAEDEIL